MTKQPGQWQTINIYLNNGHTRITLNGELVVDVNLDDHLDKADESKGITRRIGHVGLQNYGQRLQFRNIKIRPLD